MDSEPSLNEPEKDWQRERLNKGGPLIFHHAGLFWITRLTGAGRSSAIY